MATGYETNHFDALMSNAATKNFVDVCVHHATAIKPAKTPTHPRKLTRMESVANPTMGSMEYPTTLKTRKKSICLIWDIKFNSKYSPKEPNKRSPNKWPYCNFPRSSKQVPNIDTNAMGLWRKIRERERERERES